MPEHGRKVQPCHAEHIRCAQCKLREASRCPSSKILRFAQDDIVRSLKLMLIGPDLSRPRAWPFHPWGAINRAPTKITLKDGEPL